MGSGSGSSPKSADAEGSLPGLWLPRLQVMLHGEPFGGLLGQPSPGPGQPAGASWVLPIFPVSVMSCSRKRLPGKARSWGSMQTMPRPAPGSGSPGKHGAGGPCRQNSGHRIQTGLVQVLLHDRGASTASWASHPAHPGTAFAGRGRGRPGPSPRPLTDVAHATQSHIVTVQAETQTEAGVGGRQTQCEQVIRADLGARGFSAVRIKLTWRCSRASKAKAESGKELGRGTSLGLFRPNMVEAEAIQETAEGTARVSDFTPVEPDCR